MKKIRVFVKGGTTQEATFESFPESTPVLDCLEEHKIQLPYGCREGACGSCLIRVRAGAELLEPLSPMEEDTLSRIEDSRDKRLACRARFKAGASGCLDIEEAW